MINLECTKLSKSVLNLIKNLVIYQYGSESSKIFSEIDVDMLRVCYSKNTKRIRSILYGDNIFITIRASDYMVIPHITFAKYLHKALPYPCYRVVVLNEIVEEILNGYTVFAKHIISGDPRIKPYDEVMIVDERDNLIGVGRALLDYEGIITSFRGAAIQIREKNTGGASHERIQS